MGSMRSTRWVRAGAAVGLLAVSLAVVATAGASTKPAKTVRAAKAVHAAKHSGKSEGLGKGFGLGKGNVYAYVIPGEVSLNVAPVLVARRSHDIVAVTEPAAGLYCLRTARGIDASRLSWTVSAEASRSSVASHAMFAYADAAACGSSRIGVRTFELRGTSAVPSEQVAFMLVAG
jgi:hypothetical protein